MNLNKKTAILIPTHKVIHFVGIGGIGMSGIAEVLHNLGYKVTGSDLKASNNTKRLQDLGIQVICEHQPSNVVGADVVVISSAIQENNNELQEARRLRLPIVRRADMLYELMRLKLSIAVTGTHGKTTTTSLMGAIMEQAGFDPTVVNGGIINAYGTNARLGSGDWIVVEADESDGSFLKLAATVKIITNINPEHMDYYKNFENVMSHYQQFAQNIPFFGFTVLCLDNPNIQNLIPLLKDREFITYGFSPQADVTVKDIQTKGWGWVFDVVISHHSTQSPKVIEKVEIAIPGRHNIQNALACIAVALNLGIDIVAIKKALEQFRGVKRRFTRVGEWLGGVLIDDYAHHPSEIQAVLQSAFDLHPRGKIIAVFQPHRYSRLSHLFESFAKAFNLADVVYVVDVYSAGESVIEGYTAESLVDAIRNYGHKNVTYAKSMEHLEVELRGLIQSSDFVIFMGAGDITKWPHHFVSLGS